jgi:hypothetical protein
MSLVRHVLGRAFLLGLISAMMMVVAIHLRDEIWNNRTLALVIIWLLGGFTGTVFGVMGLELGMRIFGNRMAQGLRALIFLPAFLAAGALVFYVLILWQRGFELHPEHPVRSLLFGSVQTMAMFVYTVSHYMLPWMAPAMIVVGYALMPRAKA